ncbi:hypothetical protein ARZXY2_4024 [Arthrobacter sp. ZXY-2]|nr:hypothetical protein ARZXY2_4024 [Arthrobacter sp. ZXY-2]
MGFWPLFFFIVMVSSLRWFKFSRGLTGQPDQFPFPQRLSH